MDSDGQFDIDELAGFLPLMDSYDAVFGYRIARKDALIRRVNAWAWKQLVTEIFSFEARDIDCAFKLLRADFVANAQLRSDGAMISTELRARFAQARLVSAEVGVHHYPRQAGKATGSNLAVIGRAFSELLSLRREIVASPCPVMKSVHTASALSLKEPQSNGAAVPVPFIPKRVAEGLVAHRRPWIMNGAILAIICLSALLQFAIVTHSTGASFDIQSFMRQAAAVLPGRISMSWNRNTRIHQFGCGLLRLCNG